MAYNFVLLANGALEATIVADSEPRALTFQNYSLSWDNGRIKIFDCGQFKKSFLFTEIGKISDDVPTDLADAYTKLSTISA